MSRTIALVPARTGSKGVPGKNFKLLGGKPLYAHAIECAIAAGIPEIVVSTDRVTNGAGMISDRYTWSESEQRWIGAENPLWHLHYLARPSELAQDDTPMFDVVQHAAETLQLEPDDIIVLLQPTQPFRTPEHVSCAITLLRETQADSVVSVVPLPLTHSPEVVLALRDGHLWPRDYVQEMTRNEHIGLPLTAEGWSDVPTRRQDAFPAYKRDGTVYAFFVKTLASGSIYGSNCRPLILDPSETCELDTPEQWAAVEARWRAQHG